MIAVALALFRLTMVAVCLSSVVLFAADGNVLWTLIAVIGLAGWSAALAESISDAAKGDPGCRRHVGSSLGVRRGVERRWPASPDASVTPPRPPL